MEQTTSLEERSEIDYLFFVTEGLEAFYGFEERLQVRIIFEKFELSRVGDSEGGGFFGRLACVFYEIGSYS